MRGQSCVPLALPVLVLVCHWLCQCSFVPLAGRHWQSQWHPTTHGTQEMTKLPACHTWRAQKPCTGPANGDFRALFLRVLARYNTLGGNGLHPFLPQPTDKLA